MRTWRLISLFSVLALVLAACGDGGASPSEAEESEPAESTGAESEAPPSEGAGEPQQGGTLVFAGARLASSLDPALTGSIMEALRRINMERGLTLVVSQHQLATALEYATRIVGFRGGRVVFDGPPSAVTPSVVESIYGGAAP